ncbi:MAG: hypothetical protein E7260_07450 [Lachnospiraceae bacterium]|nr:hypothetical protein [Lachnospiraceae bacterium]
MKIWILDCDVNEYENLLWEEELNLDEIRSFDGRKKEQDWRPIKVKCMYGRKKGNTFGFSAHIPVFDKTAVNVLSDFLEGNAEILPLESEDGEFYSINITNILDCIDYENSIFKTFRDGKTIMRFIKYEFVESKVCNQHLFKICDGKLRRPFVSDEFRTRVIESGLLGFKFELAWDSEGSGR